MLINCIIVEDEPLAQEKIRGFLEKIPFARLQAVFDNGLQALTYLRSNKVDLLFLDINMDDFSGIRLLEIGHIDAEVIITTAYQDYALKGYEFNVTDYLLKPFTFERFFQAVDRAQHNLLKKTPAPDKKFIFVKTEYRLEKLFLGDILYIEGMRDYRRIHTVTKPVMTLQTFRDFEQELPPSVICRVHKSYMVALDKIDSIEKDTILVRGTAIPISETYKKDFFQLIGSG